MIEDLISRIVSQVGLDEATSSKAVGLLFAFMNKEGDSDLVGQLMGSIPGAEALAASQQDALEGGLLGGLAGAAGGLLGGKAGAAMEALNVLKKADISMDQAKEMGPIVSGFLKENADSALLGRVLESAPALKALL